MENEELFRKGEIRFWNTPKPEGVAHTSTRQRLYAAFEEWLKNINEQTGWKVTTYREPIDGVIVRAHPAVPAQVSYDGGKTWQDMKMENSSKPASALYVKN